MIPAGRWRVERCDHWGDPLWAALPLGEAPPAGHFDTWAEAMAYVDAVVTRARREQP